MGIGDVTGRQAAVIAAPTSAGALDRLDVGSRPTVGPGGFLMIFFGQILQDEDSLSTTNIDTV